MIIGAGGGGFTGSGAHPLINAPPRAAAVSRTNDRNPRIIISWDEIILTGPIARRTDSKPQKPGKGKNDLVERETEGRISNKRTKPALRYAEEPAWSVYRSGSSAYLRTGLDTRRPRWISIIPERRAVLGIRVNREPGGSTGLSVGAGIEGPRRNCDVSLRIVAVQLLRQSRFRPRDPLRQSYAGQQQPRKYKHFENQLRRCYIF